MTWWIVISIVSIIINLLLILYARLLVSKIAFVKNNKQDLLNELGLFTDHVKRIHEHRLFYGDPIFLNLVKHGKDLQEYLASYEQLYDLLEDDYEPEEDYDLEEEIFSYE